MTKSSFSKVAPHVRAMISTAMQPKMASGEKSPQPFVSRHVQEMISTKSPAKMAVQMAEQRYRYYRKLKEETGVNINFIDHFTDLVKKIKSYKTGFRYHDYKGVDAIVVTIIKIKTSTPCSLTIRGLDSRHKI